MGVTACKRCGGSVNESASGCPHCGADPRTGELDLTLETRLAERARAQDEAAPERTGTAVFKDAPGMAIGLLGAALGPYLLVGAIGAAAVAVANQVQIDAFLTPEIRAQGGLVRISLLHAAVAIVANAWVGATLVAFAVAHVRHDRRPTVRDLGAGLPFVLWCALGSALEWLATSAATWYLGPLIALLLLFVLLLFIFYQQIVVDEHTDTFSAFGKSFRMVSERYGPVLVYAILGGLIYVGIAVVGTGVGALVGDSLAGRQLVTGLVGTPFILVYATVLYFLAIGERPLLEARTSPKAAATGESATPGGTATPGETTTPGETAASADDLT
jgi:hypothetical protein